MIDLLTAAELRARGGLKWTKFEADVLAARVAEMDFGLAPAISDALHDAVDRADTAYPYADIEDRAAKAASGFWAKRLGWEVDTDRMFFAPDVTEGIRRAVMTLTRPDSPVVLHTPAYHPFFLMVARAGRRLADVPCSPDADGRYRLDIDAIDRAFAEGAGSIVLCNPWNPVGRVLSAGEVAEVVSVAAGHGARVICDEIHASLIFDGTQHTVAAALDPDTVVTITAASKAFNLPGLRCAQVVLTNDTDVEAWADAFPREVQVGVSTFGLIASAAAYADGGSWLDEVVAYLESNRRLLGALIETHFPDVVYREPEGTYLAWLDFRPYGLDMPAAHFLQKAQVALAEGSRFGDIGSGHARINFATPAPILTEIVERMGRSSP